LTIDFFKRSIAGHDKRWRSFLVFRAAAIMNLDEAAAFLFEKVRHLFLGMGWQVIVKILGSAAGGGFPQWNCNAPTSRLAWQRADGIAWRTQSSIAVSVNGGDWAIVNASPDIRQQIQATPELQPSASGPGRNSPIKAVILTNGDIDHVAGLLSLRERQPFELYGTERVLNILRQNNLFEVLAPDVVKRIAMPLNEKIEIVAAGKLIVEAFPVAGKVPLYLEDASQGEGFGTQLEDVIALRISAEGSATVLYIPGCASIDESLLALVHGADCLLFDGTVYTDNELVELDVSPKTGRRMGHVPIAGEGGSLHAFDGAGIGRKIYIHINTTNPILKAGSAAEAAVRDAGWEIAQDGLSFAV
jgi:pyrroloquinoline quinone biosynthesis protein B